MFTVPVGIFILLHILRILPRGNPASQYFTPQYQENQTMKNAFIAGLVCLFAAGQSAEMRNFTFTYDVELRPNSGSYTRIWIPIPPDTPVQKISNLEILSDVVYEIRADEIYGNNYFYAQVDSNIIKPLNIEIKFDVSRQVRGPLNDKLPGTRDLQASTLVPVNGFFKDQLVQNGMVGTDEVTARKIYNFILEEMIYAKPKQPDDAAAKKFPTAYERYSEGAGWGRGDASYACQVGVGNCTDFHSYFLSLARSAGIPARFYMGIPIPDDENGEIGGYHCWADFYIPEKGWIPVDISEADKYPEKQDYYFGTLDPDRISFTVGRDIPLYNLSTKKVNYFIYPIVEIDGIRSQAFTRKFLFEELK